jgi:hypothetical protein
VLADSETAFPALAVLVRLAVPLAEAVRPTVHLELALVSELLAHQQVLPELAGSAFRG